MIWDKPQYKHRTLEEWLEGAGLPIGIEKHVETATLPKKVKEKIKEGVLLIVSDEKNEKDHVVAAVIRSLKDHADEVAFFTTSQALRGLSRPQRWDNADAAAHSLEDPDLLILTNTDGMTKREEEILDRTLVARGYRPPRVTVLVGKTGIFRYVCKAYGKDRTYELGSSSAAKGAGR